MNLLKHMSQKTQWSHRSNGEDVTTCVLISAVITPKTTYFGTSLLPGAPYFFLFRNMAFTFTDIQQIHVLIVIRRQLLPVLVKHGRYFTEEATNASIIVLPAILDSMKGSEDFNGYTDVPDTSKDVVKSNGTVSFAAGAPNYYYVPIRHFRDELQSESMAYGRYGVVRNSWYNLLLTSIKNYGTGEIPKDRPEPDDKR